MKNKLKENKENRKMKSIQLHIVDDLQINNIWITVTVFYLYHFFLCHWLVPDFQWKSIKGTKKAKLSILTLLNSYATYSDSKQTTNDKSSASKFT